MGFLRPNLCLTGEGRNHRSKSLTSTHVDCCLAGFATENAGGHGSHTAGTAAGVMLDSPTELQSCGVDEELGCIGGCFESTVLNDMATNIFVDFDALCSAHGCDGMNEYGIPCLSSDVIETLATHGGVAPGAKISVFDVTPKDGLSVWADLALNGLWDAVEETGCKVHSNSWASQGTCVVDFMSIAFDGYMYQVRWFTTWIGAVSVGHGFPSTAMIRASVFSGGAFPGCLLNTTDSRIWWISSSRENMYPQDISRLFCDSLESCCYERSVRSFPTCFLSSGQSHGIFRNLQLPR